MNRTRTIFRSGLRALALLLLLVAAPEPAAAQGTREDYARAERFLGWNTRELVVNGAVDPEWIGDDRFWYRNRGPSGYEYLVVDAATGNRRPLFDHARLASALSEAADTAYDPTKLPFRDLRLLDGRSIRFQVRRGRNWTCDLDTYRCVGPDSVPVDTVTEVRSPDGRWVAFRRDHDLWVRSVQTGEEIRLSEDGEPDHGYASQVGCCAQVTSVREERELRPVLVWSPDSRAIATHRVDERGVPRLHLLETKNPRPVLHSYPYALPGDSVIPVYDLYVFDVASRSRVKVTPSPLPAVNTTCCWLVTDTIWKDVRWGNGSDRLYYTAGRRSFDRLDLVAADARSGETRVVLSETSPTFVETNLNSGGVPNWRVIGGDREVVWFSERDGWGHLYLYDARTGELKNRITSGPWNVSEVVHVDEPGRWLYFTARGREPGRDPYFRHLYRVRLDGSGLELLTPEDADHDVGMSPGGRFFVDSHSTPERPPVTVLRRADGQPVRTIQEADVSRLLAEGWSHPEPFVVKARDGTTDVYGLLYRPSNFDPSRKYPIIDYIYPGPQVGSIGERSFNANPRGNARALAELGFLVVQLDAMGTPLRSKAFHDAYYGNMGDNGLPDHVAAIKQLAARHPQVDLDRVGIFGHSGGGFASTGAMLRHPDFFKVAVSSAGNHDNRSYDYTWGEKYQGVLERDTLRGGDNFDSQSNWMLAERLQGKLLLMYGTLDDNVHPNATLLLIDELIKHDKDFDLLVLPNRNHGFANDPYVIRRTWDYFVEHLLGVDPPAGFRLSRPPPG